MSVYLGKSGEFLVMSELLFRRWNVAVPEIDVGDDVLIISDRNGEVIKAQVKTATLKNEIAHFSLPINRLGRPSPTRMIFIFVMRGPDGWLPMIVMDQEIIADHFENGDFGKADSKNLNLRFWVKSDGSVWAGKSFKLDFSTFFEFRKCVSDASC